jgi:hypothetical protein
MIEPLHFYGNGMTDDQLKTVGIISLNWSMVEKHITDILGEFYAITDLDVIELIAPLSLEKKLELFKKKIERDPKPPGYEHADWPAVSNLFTALKKDVNDFREGRNHIIHGTVIRFFGVVREPAILSGIKRKTKELSELPKILDQSTYLTHVVAHLWGALYGSVLKTPLPDRPD